MASSDFDITGIILARVVESYVSPSSTLSETPATPTATSTATPAATTETPAAATTTPVTTEVPTVAATTSTTSPTIINTFTVGSAMASASAAASASASAISDAVHNTSNKGFSTGALAGGIVGAFVGGCLIAFVIASLLFRKRKPGNSAGAGSYGSASAAEGGKPVVSYATKNGTVASESFGPATVTAAFVPESADDGTVSNKIESLFDQISLHIDNYYVRLASNPLLTTEEKESLSRYNSPFVPESLASLLSVGKPQRAALTHALAYALLEAIRPASDAGSLLPACFRWGPLQDSLGHPNTAQDAAAFNWRMLTSQLNASAASARDDQYINAFVAEFTTTFATYRNGDFPQSEQVAHLTSVVKAAFELGVWLFAQPCTFKFDWQSGSTGESQLVIFPSVLKVCDERGRRLNTPQMVVAVRATRI
ncbi:uncharacterized protein N7483_008010 [Penicillium malachiteum]|uniref:uncharacterized protein n=1 Tax=Penicillium malachiteum TaxID=1324776 RepID=UPI0025480BDF|nr:uncharacterized protein N7483_008010 [Penicillium malachiteum]KAJ5726653.1 hypothetical protein N7483_008010 [Penicillium malachiteum]